MDPFSRYAERDFTFYDLNHMGKEIRAYTRLDQHSTPYQPPKYSNNKNVQSY